MSNKALTVALVITTVISFILLVSAIIYSITILGIIATPFAVGIPLICFILSMVALTQHRNKGKGKGLGIAAITLTTIFVLLILAYHGVFSPSSAGSAHHCEFQMGLNCKGYYISASENMMMFEIENGMGQGVMLYTMNVQGTKKLEDLKCSKDLSSERWNRKPGRYLAENKAVEVKLDCTGANLADFVGKDYWFNVELELYENDTNHLYAQTMIDEFRTEIDP